MWCTTNMFTQAIPFQCKMRWRFAPLMGSSVRGASDEAPETDNQEQLAQSRGIRSSCTWTHMHK